MRIDGTLRRRRRLSLTSLIDVIFLLLLFFMLSSTFTRFAEVDISTGRAGEPTGVQALPDVFIRLGAQDSWKINGAELPTDLAMAELVRLEENGAKTLILTVRPDVSSQALVDALERIKKSSKLKVSVAG